MPAVPSSFLEPLWVQFQALIPAREVTHPLGCHRPRIADRVVFDKLVARLVLGGAYSAHGDDRVSATTLRQRRDEWINAGIFAQIEQIALEAYDRFVGLDLDEVSVDGCIVKAPCGGDNTGKSPVDRGKSGLKRSVLVDGAGIPLGVVLAGAHRNDSPLLRPTLECLGRLEHRFGVGLPEHMSVHLDAGYDSKVTRELLDELAMSGHITPKGAFIRIDHTRRWQVERTNSWHNRGFRTLHVVTDRVHAVQAAWIALANAIIIIRRLIRTAWTTHRWDTRPHRRP